MTEGWGRAHSLAFSKYCEMTATDIQNNHILRLDDKKKRKTTTDVKHGDERNGEGERERARERERERERESERY